MKKKPVEEDEPHPSFRQEQLEYLRKVFTPKVQADTLVPTSQDELIELATSFAMCAGAMKVVEHIQSLIDQDMEQAMGLHKGTA